MLPTGSVGFEEYNKYMFGSTNISIGYGNASLPTKVDSETRSLVCKSCVKYRPNTDVCGMCGCGAVISQRAKSPLGKCPLDKWDK